MCICFREIKKKYIFAGLFMKIYIKYSDQFGVTANVLCMLHCLFTPFLFVYQAKTATYFSEITFFWGFLNYFLLFISLIAVYQSCLLYTSDAADD